MIVRDFAQEELVASTSDAVARRVEMATNTIAVFPVRQAVAPAAPDTARAALAKAIEASVSAAALLERARKATASARALVAATTREAERLVDADREIANDRAADLVAAIRAGAAPTFAAAPGLSDNAAALADAQNRRRAAEGAVAALAAEERDAEGQVAETRAAVASAVKAVLIAEAEALALVAAEADRRATALRCRIGTSAHFVSNLTSRRSDALQRIIAANDESRMVDGNAPLGFAARAASGMWRDFAAALETDARADLKFGA